MKIISHRGGAKIAPENSLESIRASIDIGVEALEIDVRLTRDKKLVVFHDPTLRRMANLNRLVSRLSLDEIKKITLRNGTHIPSLDEFIAETKNLTLFIEGKERGWAEILNQTLNNYPNKKRFKVISFNGRELQKFHRLSKEIKCYYTKFYGFRAISTAKRNNYEGINIHYAAFNPIIYALAKRKGIKINLFTLNSTFIFKLLGLFPFDIGIITDKPDKFLKLVKPIEQ